MSCRVVLSEAVDGCICFTRKIQHGRDWERSWPQGSRNVHNFLMTVRPLRWACGIETEMLLILKKPIFDLMTPRYFLIWQSKEMSHDFVRGQSVAETCFSHWVKHPMRGWGALVRFLAATSVMHASRVQTSLVLCGSFREISSFVPSQSDWAITLMTAWSSWKQCIDINFALGHTTYTSIAASTKHLYNICTTSSMLLQHCTSAIQMFCAYTWYIHRSKHKTVIYHLYNVAPTSSTLVQYCTECYSGYIAYPFTGSRCWLGNGPAL